MRPEQAAIVARRRLVRAAFDLIRNDPEKKKLVLEFARALGGSGQLTQRLFNEASDICINAGKEWLVEAEQTASSALKIATRTKNFRLAKKLMEKEK